MNDYQLRRDQQQVRELGFPEVEPTLEVPAALRKALSLAGLAVAREFVPLMDARVSRSVSRSTRRSSTFVVLSLTPRIAASIAPRWTKTNPSLRAAKERWGIVATPAARPPGVRQRMQDDWTKWPRAEAHGLTSADVVALLEQQDYRCPICARAFAQRRDVVLDHNHLTGAFRGLICGSCNTALGLLRDSPSVLEAAARYLRERGHYGPKETT